MTLPLRVAQAATLLSRTRTVTVGQPARPQQANGRGPQSYAELRRRVVAAGLLERSYGYYALLGGAVAVGFAAVGLLLAFVPGWGDALAALVLGLLFVQLGFLVHDAGHNQIFQQVRNNRAVGLFCATALAGVSFENWVDKHNAHHAHSNEVDDDPDINHPLLAFTPEQAAERRGLLRWLVRYQGRLYFFLAMFATLGFRVDAWIHVIRDRAKPSTRMELALIVVNNIAWLVVPSLLLGVGRWLPVFLISQLLAGVYMVSVFAPNHKGMPLIRGRRPTFLEQQVLTSRNVTGGPVVDFLYGGLNFQIEHHLFPTIARNRLPVLREIVKPFCAEVGLSYDERSVVSSYAELIRQLDAVGRGEEGAGALVVSEQPVATTA